MPVTLDIRQDFAGASIGSGAELVSGIGPRLKNYASDEFDAGTQQNLLTGGDGAKLYGWNLLNAASADAVDVNITNAGKLTIDCSAVNSQISLTPYNAALAYKNTSSNLIEVVAQFADNADAANQEQAGIVIATTNLQNSIAFTRYWNGSAFAILAVRTVAGVRTIIANSIINATILKVVLEGKDRVSFLYKLTAGDTGWTPFASWAGLAWTGTLKVGVSAASGNTSNNYAAQFDYVRITGTGVGVFSASGALVEEPIMSLPVGSVISAAEQTENALAAQLGFTSYGSAEVAYLVNGGAYSAWMSVAAYIAAIGAGITITDPVNSFRRKFRLNSDGMTPNDVSEGALTVSVPTPEDYLAPDVADVREGVTFGPLTGLENTGTLDLASGADLRAGVTQDGGAIVGTCHVPQSGETLFGVPVDHTLGSYVEVPENRATLGFKFGANGTQYTGQALQINRDKYVSPGGTILSQIETGILNVLGQRGLAVNDLAVDDERESKAAPPVAACYIVGFATKALTHKRLRLTAQVRLDLVFQSMRSEAKRREAAYPIITGACELLLGNDLGGIVSPIKVTGATESTTEAEARDGKSAWTLGIETSIEINASEEAGEARIFEGLNFYLEPDDDGVEDAQVIF